MINFPYESLCRASYLYFKGFVTGFKPSQELKDAIKFTEIKAKPEEVYSLAVASTTVSLITVSFISFFFIITGIVKGLGIGIVLFFLIIPIILYFYLKDYPVLIEKKEKTTAIGEIPELTSFIVMSLRINPNIEISIKFASDHSKGIFRKVLKRMMYSIRTGEYSAERGLSMLGEEWKEYCPEFTRSIRLIIASTLDKTEERRQITLDNATSVLLSGLRERTGESARKLHTPVMIIFTFGVILPLIFIALIPLASFMGFGIGAPVVALLYLIVLPVILYIAINFVVSYRPITIPPIKIPSEEYYDFRIYAVSIFTGFIIMLPGILQFAGINIVDLGKLSAMPWIMGISAALAVYFFGTSYKIKRIRDEISQMESEFGETLYQLGVILSEGRSLEDAMSRLKEISKKTKSSEVFSISANNVRLFNMSLKSAFFDDKAGSARKVFSGMIRCSLETIICVCNRGSSAIASLTFRLSEHIKNVHAVDAEIKRTLGSVVSSMQLIAGIVGPLVGGMISSMSTVLAGSMGKVAAEGVSVFGLGGGVKAIDPISPEAITIIVGLYVIETAVILISFSDDLIYGGDAVMKKYHFGIYIPIAAGVFILSSWLAGSIIGGLG